MTTATRKPRATSRSRQQQAIITAYEVDMAYIACRRTAWLLQRAMHRQPGMPLADALSEVLRHHGLTRRQVTLRSRCPEKRVIAALMGSARRAG